jgi:hypothetical protein
MSVTVPASDDRRLALVQAAIARVLEAAAHRAKQRLIQTEERWLERAMRRALRAQGRALLAALDPLLRASFPDADDQPAAESATLREADGPDWQRSFDDAYEQSRDLFTAPLKRSVPRIVQAAGDLLLDEMGISGTFDLASPAAVAYLGGAGADMKFADDLFDGLADVPRADVNRIIQRGVETGASYQSVAEELRRKFDSYHDGLIRAESPQEHIRDRAELIATTVAGDAYEAATNATAQQLAAAGLVMEKSWLTVGDDRVDVECEDNENDGWIGLDDGFSSGQLRPPAHPACRCTLLYRRKQT